MGSTSTACAVHRREHLISVFEHQPFSGPGSLERLAIQRGRSAKKLAMRGIAKIKTPVPAFSCN